MREGEGSTLLCSVNGSVYYTRCIQRVLVERPARVCYVILFHARHIVLQLSRVPFVVIRWAAL